ncbi:hypothetical protein [Rhodopseudomonas palustris]|uniref:hypothetical protein n=1 Tax=Rhodopseudomonas palustris TaxID=1076 RepID=UPI0010580998|nr:hypothetical protein [Rhodopseudomonas palustris]
MSDESRVALVSHNAIWQPDALTPARLKAGTLLFDKLLFVNTNEESLPDYVTSFPSADGRNEAVNEGNKRRLSNCWESTVGQAPFFSIYGDFDHTFPDQDRSKWPWDSAPDSLKNATRAVVERLYQTSLAEDSGPAGYEAYKYGGYIMSDILYWRQFFPRASFLGDTASEDILRHIAVGDQLQGPIWTDVEIPGFNGLSWDDVAELRQSDYLKAFRTKFFQLSNAGRSSRIMDEYRDALERLADYCRPKVGRNVLLGVLGNIPLPIPINPISIGSSVQTVAKDLRMKSEFGWAFFVRDVQTRITQITPADGR